MKTKINQFFAFAMLGFVAVFAGSCAHNSVRMTGNEIEKNFEVTNFTKIEISGAYEILLIKGDKPGVSITGDEAIFDLLEVKVTGSVLKIEHTEKVNFNDFDSPVIRITYTSLSGFEMAGAGDIKCNDTLTFDEFNLSIAGACQVDLMLNGNRLVTETSGASNLVFKGNVNTAHFELAGAGAIEAFELLSKNCKVELSGVGAAEVFASESIDVSIAGVGSVEVKGKPKNVTQDIVPFGKLTIIE
ncbi:MAG TPA: hypothetical protein DCQ31_01120 [Bacteroidales bacterium]|nr:hypothetical protein [Bacteroidales bacterium]